MAECGGLLNRCRGQNLYRGFESPPLRQILYLIQTSSLGGTRNNAISIASNPTRQNLLANCWPGLREVRKTVAH